MLEQGSAGEHRPGRSALPRARSFLSHWRIRRRQSFVSNAFRRLIPQLNNRLLPPAEDLDGGGYQWRLNDDGRRRRGGWRGWRRPPDSYYSERRRSGRYSEERAPHHTCSAVDLERVGGI